MDSSRDFFRFFFKNVFQDCSRIIFTWFPIEIVPGMRSIYYKKAVEKIQTLQPKSILNVLGIYSGISQEIFLRIPPLAPPRISPGVKNLLQKTSSWGNFKKKIVGETLEEFVIFFMKSLEKIINESLQVFLDKFLKESLEGFWGPKTKFSKNFEGNPLRITCEIHNTWQYLWEYS